MNPETINIPAVLIAAGSAFVLGGLWYSPVLFGRVWQRETGLSDESLGQGMVRVFGISFLASLVMATNLAFFLNDAATTTPWGAMAGGLAGFGWGAMALLIVGLFERRSVLLCLINGAYITLALVLMGTILGSWR